jgi:hypothetical protein
MAVNLSPVGGVAAQFFNNNGVILTGGKIFTYTAGTTTPQATYTSNTGSAAHSNPIILDASGRVPSGEIWLTDGLSYKFVIKDATDVLIGTYDNVIGINSNFINYTGAQEIQTATAGQTVFTLTTMQYQPGTNSLSVFVDGVNQYGPGAQYAYVETSGTVVTFVNGLHVGASVKFTTATINSSSYGDAFQISYTPPFVDSVATNVGDKLAQTVSVDDFGAVGDGVVDDTGAIQASVDALLGVGGEIQVNAGTYKLVGPVVMDYAGRTGDAGTNPTGISFVGQGIQSTLFKPSVNGDAAIEILGDNVAGHLIYGPFGGFTVTPQSGATGTIGAYLYDVAFATFDEMFFQDMPVAIRAESVLSCQFNRLRITGGGNGVVAFKGTGFSDHNANKYFGAEFRLGTGWAYSGGPSSGLWFDNLTVQGFGTQSADAGGMDLSFTGDEGAVGVNVNGGYIEGNGGAADFRLTNSGTNTVTHVFTSVNFNRISSSKYVTHNIHAFGKNKIVLIGCSFRGFGTYTPDAARKYVEFDPTETEVICIGCDFGSTVESSNLTNLRVFSGRVDSAGAAVFLPYGWSCAKDSTGVYTVSHSLGTSLYSVNATSINANPVSVQRSVVNDNTFTIVLVNASATLTDSAFSFQLSF